jgi:hypothetical protein
VHGLLKMTATKNEIKGEFYANGIDLPIDTFFIKK